MKKLYSIALAAIMSLAAIASATGTKSAKTDLANLTRTDFAPKIDLRAADTGKSTVEITGKLGALNLKKNVKAPSKAAEEPDYSFEVLGDLCAEDGTWSKLAFMTGDDIAYVSFMLFSSYYEDSDFNAEGLDYIAQNGSLIGTDYFRRYLTLTLNNYPEGVYTMASVAMDAAGTPQALNCKRFFVTNHNPEEWQSLGMGEYTELFASAAYPDSLPEQTYKVEVLESIANPGIYRILNPCSGHSALSEMLVQHSHPHYITIDATDPDYVYALISPYGIDCGAGDMMVSSLPGYYLSRGFELQTLKDFDIPGGKLSDGAITFPTQSLLFAENNTNLALFYAGEGALLTLPRPEPEPEYDYSLEFSNAMTVTAGALPFSSHVGKDVASLFVFPVNGAYGHIDGDLSDSKLNFILNNFSYIDITSVMNSDQYSLSFDYEPGRYTNIVIALNAENEIVNAAAHPFFVDKNSDHWATVGTATFTDLFSTVIFPNDEPCTYEVPLQENINTPGYYRLVNPYREHPLLSTMAVTDHDHYIYLHTEDGMAWIEEWPSGIDYGYGEAIMISDFGYYKEYFGDTIDDLLNKYEMTDGQINGNDITFPSPTLAITARGLGFKYKYIGAPTEQALITLNKSGTQIGSWEELGLCTYVEGLFEATAPELIGKSWMVDIWESNDNPGVYRLRPYNTPDNPLFEPWSGTVEYMVVHAQDPEKVWIEPYTLISDSTANIVYKFVQFVDETHTWDSQYCSEDNYGRLADNVITFPAQSFGVIFGDSGHFTNQSGKFKILLPGVTDYSIKLTNELCTDDGLFEFTVTPGVHVAKTKFLIISGNCNDEDIPELFKNYGGVTDIWSETTQLDIVAEGLYTLAVGAFDDEDNLLNFDRSFVFHTESDDDRWHDYAVGEYTDLLLVEYNDGVGFTYEVNVQHCQTHPGLYRIEEPYKDHPIVANTQWMQPDHSSHKHYIYIHAEDPDYVWLESRPVGLNLVQGEMILSSAVGELIDHGMSLNEIKSLGIPAGKIENGNEITFSDAALRWTLHHYRMYLPVPYAGCLLKLKEVVGAQDLDLKAQDTDATYYNLQGIRIDKPQAGRLYIRCQGNKASKVIAK